MRRSSLLFGLLCLCFAFVAQADAPIVIKFSHVVAADTPKGKAAEHFAKVASEKTTVLTTQGYVRSMAI